ncbi:hypothetical protein O7621_17305 [Solwaraspora sp. WMMD937]|uniref:hypothetical protein n=1 Tax=Solwaraspora sp. WMMD937 TaxID=3016090 RepID=UPI00249AA048|nr:hypothetical protein [Solwaraspora sp. WMMD937]WFE19682.1 hypothetical protein O7621_17305 [Solwaraspora sp. WMMD937]
MIRALPRTGRQLLATAGALVLAVTTVVALSAAPASAHSQAEVIQAACGSGYDIVSDGTRTIRTPSGTVYGYVYLTYNASNGNNCVVTRKTAYHGTPTRTRVQIGVQQSNGTVVYYDDAGDYSHYANRTVYAADRCVNYFGWIWNVPTASTAAGTLASGGRTQLGNCG